MAENKMAEVVKLLNVEIGEEFLVFNDMGELVGKHKFDDENLWSISNDLMGTVNNHLVYLLNGAWTIEKKPWQPKENQDYYTFMTNSYSKFSIICSKWNNTFLDKMRYRNGFCYKTREEAEADKSKAEKFYNSNEPVSWERTVKKYLTAKTSELKKLTCR